MSDEPNYGDLIPNHCGVRSWDTKKFATREAMNAWLAERTGKIEYEEVFIADGYAVEWRRLRTL